MNQVKSRVIQFIESQGISNRKFCIKISVSHVYFSTDNAISSDVLEKIFIIFPELNMDWVITGCGEMLTKRVESLPELVMNEDQALYTNIKDELIKSLQRTIADKEKIIELLQ